MMRFLVLITLCVSLAATVIPCCAYDDCQDEVATDVSHTGKKDPCGNCSPFFACSYCAGAVVLAKHIQLSSLTINLPQYYPQETAASLSSYHPSFWQPPRLS